MPAASAADPIEQLLRNRYPAELGGVRYLRSEADLNADGIDEVIVYVYGPLVCQTGGCDLLVFRQTAGGPMVVAEVAGSRLPLQAAPTSTNGWTDLIVVIAGAGTDDGRILIQFDGEAYPGDAAMAPRVADEIQGELLMEDFDSFDDGRLLGSRSRAQIPLFPSVSRSVHTNAMTLRTKLTLCLMGMSLLTIVVMGVSARTLMLSRFDDYVVARAAVGFEQDVSRYYTEHGSWENAAAAEDFHSFIHRGRRESGEIEATAGAPGASSARPRRARAASPPPVRPSQGRRGFLGGPPPPFVATDLSGAVVLPIHGYGMGDPVSAELSERGIPIEVDGVAIAMAIPLARPSLTAMEAQYLASIEDAWVLALILALGLAVPIGLFVGSRLTRPIRELNQAMAAMQTGDLRQRVAPTSSDELGRLTERFNRMSSRLADTYDELEVSRAGLAELTLRDELTGLYNRRAFDEFTSKLLSQARRYDHEMALGMLDIDRFKHINDDFGHAVGDQVLVRAAQILRSTLRETDVVARWGGEEFSIAFPETSPEGAARLAERVRANFEKTNWMDLIPRSVTVSIGLTEFLPGESVADAMARADERLYAAKHGGRNRVRG